MAQDPTDRPRVGERSRIVVDHAGDRRPFMRGILIHSLLARGVSFEDAFRVADAIRGRLRERGVVTRDELAKLVGEELTAQAIAADAAAGPFGPDIRVGGAEQALPFSKGVLSQSLLAAALDPGEAFDVARRIEQRLVAQGVTRMERRDLRRLTYDTLRITVGPRVADRYLVWRRFQEPERPVILLLGGATGSGKTSLALEVAHRLGIGRVMSTDAIRQIMRIMLSPELMPAIHRSSYEPPSESESLSTAADPVIEAFAAQAQAVSVGVRAMVERSIDEGLSLVLDGVSIVPGLIDPGDYADRAYVIFLVVATFDETAWRQRFAHRSRGNRSADRYLENLDTILRIQEYILEQADAHDVPIVDNQNFDRSVISVIRYVTETLGRNPDFDATALL